MFSFLNRGTGNVVNVNDMDKLIGKVDIIDIREPYEYKTGSLMTAKNIPMGSLLEKPDQYLEKDKTYYIMCQSGIRSGKTVKVLEKQGFHVINVSGGMGSYVGTSKK